MVNGMATTLHGKGLSAAEATRQAYGRVAFMVQQQAASLAYKDVVSVLAILVAPRAAYVHHEEAAAADRRTPPH